MIKLPEISDVNKNKFFNDTRKKIVNLLIKNKKNLEFEKVISYCSTEEGELDNEKIKILLTGDFSKLKEIINEIGIIEKKKSGKNKEAKNTIHALFENEYTNFYKRKFGRTWAQAIGVTVCPYCNRSYIFTTSKKGTRPQYDHYFPKSKYPYLALSMYNLVPCCGVCNTLKLDKDTVDNPIIYPYQDSYGHQAEFEAIGVNTDNIASWLGAATEYTIKLRYKDEIDPELKKKIEQSVKTFRIEDLYSKHSSYIKDILRTTYIYHDDYFEGLVIQYPELFHSQQEAKNFVFFNYLEEKEWGKRVLAKLTHDIVQKVTG